MNQQKTIPIYLGETTRIDNDGNARTYATLDADALLERLNGGEEPQYFEVAAEDWAATNKQIRELEIQLKLALTVRITIPCAEGPVYREATGIEDEETSSFGDPTSNAESMALRRAAAKFGLGLDLYDKKNRTT